MTMAATAMRSMPRDYRRCAINRGATHELFILLSEARWRVEVARLLPQDKVREKDGAGGDVLLQLTVIEVCKGEPPEGSHRTEDQDSAGTIRRILRG